MALERRFAGPVIITSTQGGTNIEEIAEEHPEAIIRHPIDIVQGLQREDALSIAKTLQFRTDALDQVNNKNNELTSSNYIDIYSLVFLGC